jgi:hypothetical protein
MNYPAFTNDSLTMMYEGIRGALAADDALKSEGHETRFRVRETRSGNGTPVNLSRKCSSAECFSELSTGRKIRRRCPWSEASRSRAKIHSPAFIIRAHKRARNQRPRAGLGKIDLSG